ncbi:MucB/RseB C-terminal domain-containing protein [Pseudomarimonas arenosa]|uniref:MucB/RseB C-terminal domain-containing protein n=1 Tax=Pseudomarimonas arenosa TaxID=2774145 RepID=A0AAW3ZFG7_9GAMM|nr:MucB/RseB C-terminal domain-containing protein [Pseudomarimonas arenosa]MBD8524806.1 MucB/RseB C-terminal domain-containing protein [Pseudomarimonas arenosa]
MQTWRSRFWLLIALCWLSPAWAQSAVEWVEGIQAAVEKVAFDGVVVYQRDGQLDALSVRHDEQGAQLQRLTGPALPVGVVGPAPAEGVPLPDGLLFARTGLRVGEAGASLRTAYQTRTLPEDRVAGRTVQVVDLLARDAMRYSRRLWIDRDSGIPLRSAVYGADGQLVEQWMFAQFNVREPASASVAVKPLVQADIEAPDRARLHSVPAGFALVSAQSQPGGEHWVYCDGLARVSVFVEQVRADRAPLSGLQRRGLLSVFGRIAAGRQVVVVGEVPPATVERFAQEVVLDRAG